MVGAEHAVVRNFLRRMGYNEHNLLVEVSVATPPFARADMVAYGRELGPFDASTATIVIEFVADVRSSNAEHFAQLQHLAVSLSAPVAMLADSQRWALLAVGSGNGLDLVRESSWSEEPDGLREVLNPAALLAAKLGARQLSLFPFAAQVSAKGRAARQRALAPRVAAALSAATSAVGFTDHTSDDAAADHARAARLVVGALTAVVLRDKDAQRPVSKTWKVPSSDLVVNRALTQHTKQFEWLVQAGTEERVLLESLVEDFADIDFGSVEPALLSELYEDVLVEDATRRRIGAHYTPPGLARRLLAWLPIEEIPPTERRVYDPTCGSGSLLIAAHDRIRDLQSSNLSMADSHRDLVERIRGGDSDPVAAGIANLALFLNALPAGNGWRVEIEDVFTRTSPAIRPTVLVANPPWLYTNTNTRDDLAHRILSQILNWAPARGLIGVVLPAGWLTRNSANARRSRDQLFSTAEILEIWRLPEGTFPNAALGAAVVLARKREAATSGMSKDRIVHRRVSHAAKLPTFYERGSALSFIEQGASSLGLGHGPLHAWWSRSHAHDSSRTVGEYVRIVAGPQPESPSKLSIRGSAPDPNIQVVEWPRVAEFGNVQDAPFRRMHFPDDMQSGSRRGQEAIGRPKILIPAVKNPERPWRIKVAIDPVGDRIAINTVFSLLPHALDNDVLPEEDILYGLLAFLGSGFASAWIDEAATTRNIAPRLVASIPAPDPLELRELSKLGRKLTRAGANADVIQELEVRTWEWVAAPSSVHRQVLERLNEAPAPEGRYRYKVLEFQVDRVEKTKSTLRAGAVVEFEGDLIRLVIPGLTSEAGDLVPLPALMPAALLRPGSAFVVVDSGQPIADMPFLFDESAYLSDTDVEEEIAAATSKLVYYGNIEK